MHWPDATAAPDPLLDPPVTWSKFQGLRTGKNGVVKSGPPRANSCIANLPKRMPPDCFSLAVQVESSVGILFMSIFEPDVVLIPAVS